MNNHAHTNTPPAPRVAEPPPVTGLTFAFPLAFPSTAADTAKPPANAAASTPPSAPRRAV